MTNDVKSVILISKLNKKVVIKMSILDALKKVAEKDKSIVVVDMVTPVLDAMKAIDDYEASKNENKTENK